MGLFDELTFAVEEISESYRERVSDDKLSFNDALALLYNATATFVRLVDSLSWASHEDRRDAILNALGRFYDLVIRPISLTDLPPAIEGLVDTAVKSFMLTVAASAIDSIVNIFDKLGWAADADERRSPQKMQHYMIF